MKTKYSTALALVLLLTSPVGAEEAPRVAPQSMNAVKLSYASVVDQSRPSVPLVEAKGVDVKSGLSKPVMTGTGVILRPDGFMVTDAALAEFGSQKGGAITVRFEDGSSETAAVAMIDRRSGLAVLKLKERRDGYPAVQIAGPTAVMSGDLYVALGRKEVQKVNLTQGVFAEAPDAAPAPTSEWVDPDQAAAPAFDTGHDWRDADIGTPLFGMDGKLAAVIAKPDGKERPIALPGAAARMLVAIVTGEMPQGGDADAPQASRAQSQQRYDDRYEGYGLPDWEPVRTHTIYTFSYWAGWGSPYWWDGYWGYAPIGWYWSGFYAPPPPIIVWRPRPHRNRHWYRDHHGSWDGVHGGWHRDHDGNWNRDKDRRSPWTNMTNVRPDTGGDRVRGSRGDDQGRAKIQGGTRSGTDVRTPAAPATKSPRVGTPKAPERPKAGRDFERAGTPVYEPESEPVVLRGPATPTAPRLIQPNAEAQSTFPGGTPQVNPANIGFGNWQPQAQPDAQAQPDQQTQPTDTGRRSVFGPAGGRDNGSTAKSSPPRNDAPRESRGRDKPKSKNK